MNPYKRLSKEEAKKILPEICGPPHRELKDEEHDHMWLILQFLEPISSSNNQRTITDIYRYDGKEYHVHFGFYSDGSPMIEEVDANDS